MTLPSKAIPQYFIRYFREALLTLLIVFALTTLILLLAGAPPFAAYYHIFKGSLGSWIKFTHVIKAWIPLSLCACGLLYTFRINLWNIGIEGQMMMGAIFTTAVLRWGLESRIPFVFLGFSFGAGIIGGGIWALLAGYLKTRGGVRA
jgi:simple sugar transport system permease protein